MIFEGFIALVVEIAVKIVTGAFLIHSEAFGLLLIGYGRDVARLPVCFRVHQGFLRRHLVIGGLRFSP